MKTRNKLLTAALALVLVGGGGSLAIWSDAAFTAPLAARTGLLDLAVEDLVVFDVSELQRPFIDGATASWEVADASPTLVDLGRFQFVPQDVVRVAVPITVRLAGDNLAAVLDVALGDGLERDGFTITTLGVVDEPTALGAVTAGSARDWAVFTAAHDGTVWHAVYEIAFDDTHGAGLPHERMAMTISDVLSQVAITLTQCREETCGRPDGGSGPLVPTAPQVQVRIDGEFAVCTWDEPEAGWTTWAALSGDPLALLTQTTTGELSMPIVAGQTAHCRVQFSGEAGSGPLTARQVTVGAPVGAQVSFREWGDTLVVTSSGQLWRLYAQYGGVEGLVAGPWGETPVVQVAQSSGDAFVLDAAGRIWHDPTRAFATDSARQVHPWWGERTITQILGAEGAMLVALADDGTIWDGYPHPTRHMSQVEAMWAARRVLQVDVTGSHRIALTEPGFMWQWQASAGGEHHWSEPQMIPTQWAIDRVAAGHDHFVALTAVGTVVQWAVGGEPVEVDPGWGERDIVDVFAGQGSSFALASDGTVWAWGDNTHGALGTGATPTVATPTRVQISEPVAALSGHGFTHFALTNSGEVWSWGQGDGGQLGDGSTTSRWQPAPASMPWTVTP